MELKKLMGMVLVAFLANAVNAFASIEQELEIPENKKVYNCLSCDGGGMRGYASLIILGNLEKELRVVCGNPHAKIWDYIDFYGGTSTGGLIAAGAALGDSIAVMLQRYKENGLKIFPQSKWEAIKTGGGLLRSRYKMDGLESVLKESHPADTWLSDITPPLLVTGSPVSQRYTLNQGVKIMEDDSINPIYNFKSYAANKCADDDYPVWQACCATAAAPSFLPAVEVCSKTGRRMMVFDGGVHSPNPSSLIFEEAKCLFKVKKEQINLLSFGTGFMAFAPHLQNYGIKELKENEFLDRNLAALAQAVHEGMEKRLKDQYFRFNPPLLEIINFVDGRPETLEKLKKYTKDYLSLPSTRHEIKRAAEALVKSRKPHFPAVIVAPLG